MRCIDRQGERFVASNVGRYDSQHAGLNLGRYFSIIIVLLSMAVGACSSSDGVTPIFNSSSDAGSNSAGNAGGSDNGQ
ncbi:MAG: hypothetical protein KTR32_39460, partial [Granulosicoccus sp.]|nr:hypothetical protein [Granulosicoccus sp.]